MKKGQTAMEYLMTYGWAILIIVVVIAVLFYLGVLNPPVPSSCIFQTAGISCVSNKLNANNGRLLLNIGQATGHQIRINGVACTQNTSPTYLDSNNITYNPSLTNAIIMNPGDTAMVADPASSNGGVASVNCTDANSNQVGSQTIGTTYINGVIYINYTEIDSGVNRIATAVYTANYEA